MIHSASDFGQRLPAVAVLSAVTCALLLTLGRSAASAPAADVAQAVETPGASLGRLAFPRLLGGALALAAFAWGVVGASRAWAAESRWSEAAAAHAWLERNDWQGSDDDYRAMLEHAAAAAAWDPADVQHRHGAFVCRWRGITRNR